MVTSGSSHMDSRYYLQIKRSETYFQIIFCFLETYKSMNLERILHPEGKLEGNPCSINLPPVPGHQQNSQVAPSPYCRWHLSIHFKNVKMKRRDMQMQSFLSCNYPEKGTSKRYLNRVLFAPLYLSKFKKKT